jgi:voltage-gated sodium channel
MAAMLHAGMRRIRDAKESTESHLTKWVHRPSRPSSEGATIITASPEAVTVDLKLEHSILGNFTLEDMVDEFKKDLRHEQTPAVSELSSRKETQLDILESQLLDQRSIEKHIVRPQYVDGFLYVETVNRIVLSTGFQYFYFGLVAIFAVTIGAEMEGRGSKDMWFNVDSFFTFLFALECFLKMYCFGHKYFTVPWFVLEFVTTFFTFVSLGMHYRGYADTWGNTMMALKCCRIVLLVKLLSLRKEFQIIILGFTRSWVSLLGVIVALTCICYAATLFVYKYMGSYDYSVLDSTIHSNFDYDAFFGTIPRTMLTMFSILIVSEWADIARAVWEVRPILVSFFVVFTVMVTFGILNVVTGIIVATVNRLASEAAALEIEKKKLVKRQKLEEVVGMVFQPHNGYEMSEDEFCDGRCSQVLFDLIDTADFPHKFSLRELFAVLDTSGHKRIVKQQFVDGMMRMIYGNDFQRDVQSLVGAHKGRRDLVAIRKELRAMHLEVDQIHVKTGNHIAAQIKMLAPPDPSAPTVDRNRFSADAKDETPRTWDQLRETIHAAALQHCKEELETACVALETCYTKIDLTLVPKRGVMPSATIAGAECVGPEEEKFFIRNKLCSAVQRQSLYDLEKGLDHARTFGISEVNLSILVTYCDMLRRHLTQHVGVSTEQLQQALISHDWYGALDMVIEVALKRGADKSLIMSALARLCADSHGSGVIKELQKTILFDDTATSRQVRVREEAGMPTRSVMKGVIAHAEGATDTRGRLLAVLHCEAADHAAKALVEAMAALDEAYKSKGAERLNPDPAPSGAFTREYSPFSEQEDYVFLCKQIKNAIMDESLSELRRVISYAMATGIDSRSLELEIAYRDALTQHRQGRGFDPNQVTDSMAKDDWWNALDDIVAVSYANGADKHDLLKALAKLSARSSTTCSV